MTRRVLIVDDERAMCDLVVERLLGRGYDATGLTSGRDAIALLESDESFDVVLTDLRMPDMGGIDLCVAVKALRPDVPVIVITAFGSMAAAVAAIRAGAYDFVTKPFDIEVLLVAIDRALERRALREEVTRLRSSIAERPDELGIIGRSPAMIALKRTIERVADGPTTVLITGETGTGKELVARALHEGGSRRSAPFVAVNCAAVPGPLLEADLFGHVRGAFTGAITDRRGLFAQADGGTLFLDEVGDLPLELQPKLLRALEERTFRPVGASRETRVDVRIVAATNQDLASLVEQQRFRKDLFYRINVLCIELPPLRSRGGDVLLIATDLLRAAALRAGKNVREFASAAAERLMAYPWPGNVRELQNCIERSVALAEFETIQPADLPPAIREYASAHVVVAADDPSDLASMHEVEKRYVLRVLDAVNGNKSTAARILGFDRRTLYRKLEKYGVAVNDEPNGPTHSED